LKEHLNKVLAENIEIAKVATESPLWYKVTMGIFTVMTVGFCYLKFCDHYEIDPTKIFKNIGVWIGGISTYVPFNEKIKDIADVSFHFFKSKGEKLLISMSDMLVNFGVIKSVDNTEIKSSVVVEDFTPIISDTDLIRIEKSELDYVKLVSNDGIEVELKDIKMKLVIKEEINN